ncbi:MAG: ATP-binding protein [Sphaerochaetaceae bacterium]|nr:ATP-binding protein [Sphaerochaetaceae bacterium]
MENPSKYIDRIVDKEVKKYLSEFGAVSLEGPKWCGKTWTARKHCESEFLLNDPTDNYSNRILAEIAPSKALEGVYPRLLDEWQEVPALWDAVRFDVDNSKQVGKYLLTGSTAIDVSKVRHSGTGRIKRVRMSTMSLFETGDSEGSISLKELFDRPITTTLVKPITIEQLIYLAIRGGWPESINMTDDQAKDVAIGYLENICDDMFHLDGIRRDEAKVKMLLRSLARNESTLASNNTIINDIKDLDGESISKDTVSDYLNALNRLFVINNQEPFSINLRSSTKVGSIPKHHFIDTSLAVAALGASKEMLLKDLNTFGFIFEGLVYHDLSIYAKAIGANVYHYRDSVGNEIDAIVQLQNGRWGAFEIKLGAKMIDEGASNLIRIKKIMEKNEVKTLPSFLCVISGLSNVAYTRDDGVMVVPITAMKD